MMTALAPTSTVETRFDWRDLRFFVVTPEPPTRVRIDHIQAVLPSLHCVGWFADALGEVFGRHVQIRTTRPSPDIWFDIAS